MPSCRMSARPTLPGSTETVEQVTSADWEPLDPGQHGVPTGVAR